MNIISFNFLVVGAPDTGKTIVAQLMDKNLAEALRMPPGCANGRDVKTNCDKLYRACGRRRSDLTIEDLQKALVDSKRESPRQHPPSVKTQGTHAEACAKASDILTINRDSCSRIQQ
jgi:hypothetical protein